MCVCVCVCVRASVCLHKTHRRSKLNGVFHCPCQSAVCRFAQFQIVRLFHVLDPFVRLTLRREAKMENGRPVEDNGLRGEGEKCWKEIHLCVLILKCIYQPVALRQEMVIGTLALLWCLVAFV